MEPSEVRLDRFAEAIRMLFRSQREFAEAIGVHESTVSKWLQGERPVPDHVINRLVELGIPPKFLSSVAGLAGVEEYEKVKTAVEILSSARDREARSGPNLEGPVPRRRPARLAPEIERIMVDAPTPAGQDVIIPMLESSIPAGDRVPIYEDLATQFNVTVYYRNCFTMRVKGDSMMDAGICDGDRVVIKRGHRFRDGDVIAAVVDGEMTLKGVWKKDGKIYLVPANPKYRIVEIAEESDFQCLGVCIDTFRPPKRVDWRE